MKELQDKVRGWWQRIQHEIQYHEPEDEGKLKAKKVEIAKLQKVEKELGLLSLRMAELEKMYRTH